MPAHLQAVIDATFVDGLNERQTAERLGITRHEVRTRLQAALAIAATMAVDFSCAK